MSYVVTEKCVDCKFTSCVSVCPVDAFHELPDRLYINPETCIDCNACMDECPVEAIYPDMDVPEELQEWIELNEKAEEYPQLVGQKDALKGPKCVDPDADQYLLTIFQIQLTDVNCLAFVKLMLIKF